MHICIHSRYGCQHRSLVLECTDSVTYLVLRLPVLPPSSGGRTPCMKLVCFEVPDHVGCTPHGALKEGRLVSRVEEGYVVIAAL